MALAAVHRVCVVGLGQSLHGEVWTGLPHGELDQTRTSALARYADQLEPDSILLIGQGQLLAWQATKLRRTGFVGAIVAYVPVEGPIRHSSPLAGLLEADAIVAYTAVGAQALVAALDIEGNNAAVSVIPHAIDPFQQESPTCKTQSRARLLNTSLYDPDGTWILNANRNDQRKRPELTLRAFAECGTKPGEALLVLHCTPHRPGLDLRIERDYYGLRKQVILTSEMKPGSWSDQDIGLLYKSCEIGVNSALGEGWGLVAFEHALCGGAQIMPRHAGLAEIWGEAPAWVNVGAQTIPTDEVFSGQFAETQSLTGVMKELIHNRGQTAAVAKACAARAASAELSWESVGERWRDIMAHSGIPNKNRLIPGKTGNTGTETEVSPPFLALDQAVALT
ncbi:MAG: hypothetical protein M3Q42_03680 [Pseudomonadota bacterium]|nr:hypothetical protein [Pseudomonadota bacterium]